MIKLSKSTLSSFALAASALALSGCFQAPTTEPAVSTGGEGAITAGADTLTARLACSKGPIPVAHRGTSENWPEPENSLAALERLIALGVPMAEVDVASSRDGVHFLYHDGVWEEMSTCTGPVAASDWSEASACLLKTRAGELTSSTPPRLEDYLAAANDRIMLEIDFKSSADYATTIDAIREAGMTNEVVLIAYSNTQADRLSELAPEMWLSVPRDYASYDPARHMRWFGGDAPSGEGYSIAFHPDADIRVSDEVDTLSWAGCN